MFLKLVKHELHAASRLLLPLWGALIAMAVLARGSVWMIETVDSPVTTILGVLMEFLFFLACFGVVVATMILMMVRFARTVHGDEAYLTHTLPVGTHSILLSRLLVTFLAVVCSIGMVVVGILLSTAGIDVFREIWQEIQLAFRAGGMEAEMTLLRICGLGILSILNSILMIYAAISIGHSFSTGKTGKSVLFYFILYFCTQVISTIALVVLMTVRYVSGSDASILDTMSGMRTLSSDMIWFSVLQSLCFGSIFYFLTWLMTKKHLNLS